jgi:hypothetical protein
VTLQLKEIFTLELIKLEPRNFLRKSKSGVKVLADMEKKGIVDFLKINVENIRR